MLNRIYIVVGIFAILVLAGAFIVPRFVQWSDYRDRMEALASGVLGADVTIRGDISFSLLPTPRLAFTDVIVGDAESPAATVEAVEAEFALMDFLRDRYNVTGLVLTRPVVDLVLDESGLFSSGIDLTGAGPGVSLGQARISGGSVRLTDLRADEVFTVSGIDGDLRLASFVGPFQFQGRADYGDSRFDVRFNSGAGDSVGTSRITSSVREASGAYSTSVDGLLTPGMAPKFDGTLTYRQSPVQAENAAGIRGDLVLESKITASTDRVVLTGYTLNPDENRTGTRLTGTANIQLGATRNFDATVSGGVFSLPPRDATEVATEQPYEFVRLLSEIPAPPVPPMPGKLDIDLAEMGLRGMSLRDLRLDATTDGTAWTVEQAVAHLPGDTELRLSGTVSDEAGHAGFRGDFSLDAQRLDALSQLWRRSGEDNPLFNTPGRLDGRLALGSDALGLNGGRLVFAGQTHNVEIRIGFGDEQRLDAVLQLGALDAAQTAAFQALLPDPARDAGFARSFPGGSFSLTAQAIDLAGLAARNLHAEGQWSPDDIRLSRLAASDWGGVGFDAALSFAGALTEPRITGSGKVDVASADADGLAALYEMAGIPYGWQQALAGQMPAALNFILADAESGPGQVFTAGGTLGAATLDLRAEMASGLAGLDDAHLRLVASLEAEDGPAVEEQLGLGAAPIFSGDGSLMASLMFEGSGPDGFDGRASVSQGDEMVGYAGKIRLADNGEMSGDGRVEANLADGYGLAWLAGARGAGLPGFGASSAIRFEGVRSVSLSEIAGSVGDTKFDGALNLQQAGQNASYSGTLNTDRIDAMGLAAAFFGREAFAVPGDGVWPEGPLAADLERRPSRGTIEVRAGAVTAGGTDVLGPTSFGYSWTPEAVSIDRFDAASGAGKVSLSLTQCCSGGLAARTVSGRVSLDNVAIAAALPPGAGAGLGGLLTGGVQVEGSGQSLAEVVRSLSGEGNFAIAGFTASGLSPSVFPSLAGIEDPLNTDADALETLVSLALSQGNFSAEAARGAFSIAGGTARLANLIVDGAGGRLSGSLNLALNALGLEGSFVLTPRDYADPNGLIEADTARIVARIAGTLLAPLVTVDPAEMVAAIQVRANELEVDRLEQLRLQDEARQRAAAEERNRLIEEQRRQAAEAAAQRAAEEEARRLEQERLQQQQAPQTTPPASQEGAAQPSPFTFTPTPSVNRPIGTGVNQPFDFTTGR